MDILESVTCSICIDVFENPVVIPCGHSFCENCLLNAQCESTKTVRCPLCKARTPLKSIVPNFQLRNLVVASLKNSKFDNYTELLEGKVDGKTIERVLSRMRTLNNTQGKARVFERAVSCTYSSLKEKEKFLCDILTEIGQTKTGVGHRIVKKAYFLSFLHAPTPSYLPGCDPLSPVDNVGLLAYIANNGSNLDICIDALDSMQRSIKYKTEFGPNLRLKQFHFITKGLRTESRPRLISALVHYAIMSIGQPIIESSPDLYKGKLLDVVKSLCGELELK